MHEHAITDETGDTVDIIALCSDSCHRAYAGDAYEGWSGAHESEFTTYCAQCGVVIAGVTEDENGSPCEHQRDNVVVNRFLSEEGEKCEHGLWIQVPMALLVA